MQNVMKKFAAWMLVTVMVVSCIEPITAQAETATTEDSGSASSHIVGANTISQVSENDETNKNETAGDVCLIHGDVDLSGVFDGRDAIAVLKAVLSPNPDEVKKLNQNVDLNGDGEVTEEDAILLLYRSVWKDDNWQDMLHAYQNPIWSWTVSEDKASATAEVSIPCSCGKGGSFSKKVDTASGAITVETTPSTCSTKGSVKFTATVEVGGKTLTQDKVVELPIREHKFNTENVDICNKEVTCTYVDCNYTTPAKGHDYKEDGTIPPTCTARGKTRYKCSVCNDAYEVENDNLPLGHLLPNEVEREEQAKDESGKVIPCTYVQYAKCQRDGCGAEVKLPESVERHSFSSKITTPATCTVQGIKTFSCTVCKDDAVAYTEEIPVDLNAHKWVNTDTAGVYSCSICSATKKEVDGTDKAISKSELTATENQEVQVKVGEASMKIDEATLNSLNGDDVQLEAKKLSQAEINKILTGSETTLETVYDFSLTSGGKKVDQFGENGQITITLPYTLQEGDDPNCIIVAYIKDKTIGELDYFQAVFTPGEENSNEGTITFSTNHFSEYAIAKVDKSYICAALSTGDTVTHLKTTETIVAPTCTEDGYKVFNCQICGTSYMVISTDKNTLATGHNYLKDDELPEGSIVPATCTENGKITYKCQNQGCNETYEKTIPAYSHNWVELEGETSPATCSATGTAKFQCEKCKDTKDDTLPIREHELKEVKHDPTCDENGYTEVTCGYEGCNYSDRKDEVKALGHDYQASWSNWAEDHKITLNLVCSRDEKHKVALDAVVTEEKVEAACDQAGSVKYLAKVVYNGEIFSTETEPVVIDALSHRPDENWEITDGEHYKKCLNCEGKVNLGPHRFLSETVIRPASCNKDGKAVSYCGDCGYKKEIIIPATAVHNFNGTNKCEDCGYFKGSCDHSGVHMETIPLDSECGSYAVIYICECGQDVTAAYLAGRCELEALNPDEFGWATDVQCKKCGLTLQSRVDEVQIWDDEAHDVFHKEYDAVFSKNGAELKRIHVKNISERWPSIEKGRTVLESSSSFCGATIVSRSNTTGSVQGQYLEDSSCNWVYLSSSNWEETGHRYVCSNCHAIKTDRYEECEGYSKETISLTDGSGKILTQEPLVSIYPVSDEKPEVECALIGNSCEQGAVKLNRGNTGRVYYDGYLIGEHTPYVKEVELDFRAYGLCGIITMDECACGEKRGIYSTTYDCAMEPAENGNLQCSVCGARVVRDFKVLETIDPCHVRQKSTYAIYNEKGDKLYEREEIYVAQSCEKQIQEETLIGKTCSDGILSKAVCENCGDVSYYAEVYDDHYMRYYEDYADELGLCDDACVQINTCVCGERRRLIAYHNNAPGVEYNTTSDSETGLAQGTIACPKCNLKFELANSKPVAGDEPCKVSFVRTAKFYHLGEEEPFKTLAGDETRYVHDYIYETDGEVRNCNDGFILTTKCKACDYQWREEIHGHYSVKVESFTIPEGFCGAGRKYSRYKCFCGEQEYLSTDGAWVPNYGCANLTYGFNVEHEDGSWERVDVCNNCGATHRRSCRYELLDASTCRYKADVIVTLSKDGNEVTISDPYTINRHQNDTERILNGKTCSDGITEISCCRVCGKTEQRDISYEKGQHNYQKVIDTEYRDGDFYCYLDKDACSDMMSLSCSMYNGLGTWLGGYCKQGEYYLVDTSTNLSSNDLCARPQHRSIKIYKTDAVISSSNDLLSLTPVKEYEYDSVWYDHTIDIDTATITYNKNDNDCSNGFMIEGQCLICGAKVRTGYGSGMHHALRREAIDLAQYGYPGDYLVFSTGCVCGKNTDSRMVTDSYWTDKKLNWGDKNSNFPSNSVYAVRLGSGKDLYFIDGHRTYGERDSSTCTREEVYTRYFFTDLDDPDSVILEYTFTSKGTAHDFQQIFDYGQDAGDSGVFDCRKAFTLYNRCKDCGYEDKIIYEKSSYHRHNKTTELRTEDLAGDAYAGDVILKSECFCGEDVSYHPRDNYLWEWSDKYQVNYYKLKKSGLYFITRGTSEIPGDDPCTSMVVGIVELKANFTDRKPKWSGRSVTNWHSYHNYVPLNHDEIKSLSAEERRNQYEDICGKGYDEEEVCTKCGEHTRIRRSNHSLCIVETEYNKEAYGMCAMKYDKLYVETCKCGLATGIVGLECNNRTYIGNENGYDRDACDSCKATFARKRGDKSESGCYSFQNWENIIEVEGKSPIVYDGISVDWEHTPDTSTFEITGLYGGVSMSGLTDKEICMQGYYYKTTCAKCGFEYNGGNSRHQGLLVKTEHIPTTVADSEYADHEYVVDTRKCYCGLFETETLESDCTGNIYGNGLHRCECGSYVYNDYDNREALVSDGCSRYGTRNYIIYDKDDKVLWSGKMYDSWSEHDIQRYILNNSQITDCQNGYMVRDTCSRPNCDYTWEHQEYIHKIVNEQEIQIGDCRNTVFKECECAVCHMKGRDWQTSSGVDCSRIGDDSNKNWMEVSIGETFTWKFTCENCKVYTIEENLRTETSYTHISTKYYDSETDTLLYTDYSDKRGNWQNGYQWYGTEDVNT